MKLKYYLRGLAVGVILTTIILSIANADNKPMTDAQVRQRALELGMIESDSLKLSHVSESSETESLEKESTEIESSETESSETESSETQSSETQNSETESNEKGSSESITPSTESIADSSVPPASSTIEATVSTENKASTESKVNESDEVGESFTLTIKSGDSSYTVSKALAAAGIVEDAVEYDNYLCNNGYSRKIRTGTYEITAGMSYEDIAKMIAR